MVSKHLHESLDGAGAMKIHGDLHDIWQASVDELLEAPNRRRFDELLAQIVAKLVRHHVGEEVKHNMDEGRCEVGPSLFVCRRPLLEPLLDHSAPSLVECERLGLSADLELVLGHQLQ